VLACVAPTLEGAARAARDGALLATPVHTDLPDAKRVRWQAYDGKPRGSRLIRMAPWFDDGSVTVEIQARYSWQDKRYIDQNSARRSTMTAIPASHRDLLDGQVATLATIGPDGRPQLSEVWFLAEGDTIALSLNTGRQKTKNLMANPAVNLFLLDLAVPYRYVEIRGDAEIAPDDDYSFADRVGAKYQSDLREHDQPGDSRVVVTIRPARVNAIDMTG
jgi:PPOX class probable F420-dependent enzyme